jgi:hypothetical protein
MDAISMAARSRGVKMGSNMSATARIFASFSLVC